MKKLGDFTLDDFGTGDPVAYIPMHAHGEIEHPDVEVGIVSSVTDKMVFVKYFPALKRFGWEGTTSQATMPFDLINLGPQ